MRERERWRGKEIERNGESKREREGERGVEIPKRWRSDREKGKREKGRKLVKGVERASEKGRERGGGGESSR